MKSTLAFFLFLAPLCLFSQNYVSYFTGDTADVTTNPEYGVCLMGGATENDEAMKWFLRKADGGDVLVLRASGSDGYNNYFYSELGIPINSVESIVIQNTDGAVDPYVLQQVANAEAIWFAGGDQYNYVNYFKNTPMEILLNEHINTKHAVIGGTSAGMAILGGFYFDATNGTVTNAEALADPYAPRVSLGYNDFLNIPFLENTITDTHYDDPDRRGRHTAFLARYTTDNDTRSFGIACEEYTAVCFDESGEAHVYGDFPGENDFAYFLQANCTSNYQPENCTAGNPLTWVGNNNAVHVYKVPGTPTGEFSFNVADWYTGNGGSWEQWYVNNGSFASEDGENPECNLLGVTQVPLHQPIAYPNPFTDRINIQGNAISKMILYDILGKVMMTNETHLNDFLATERIPKGIYFLKVKSGSRFYIQKLIKK